MSKLGIFVVSGGEVLVLFLYFIFHVLSVSFICLIGNTVSVRFACTFFYLSFSFFWSCTVLLIVGFQIYSVCFVTFLFVLSHVLYSIVVVYYKLKYFS